MAKPSGQAPDIATRIMERMVRMPPKRHKDMKVGERKVKANTKARPSRKERPAAND
jgi:hypothetical protein